MDAVSKYRGNLTWTAAGPLLGEAVSLARLAGLWFYQALSSNGYKALKLLTSIFVWTSTNVI